jgi:hypothetical protein
VSTGFQCVARAAEFDPEVPLIPEGEDVQELLAGGDLTDAEALSRLGRRALAE